MQIVLSTTESEMAGLLSAIGMIFFRRSFDSFYLVSNGPIWGNESAFQYCNCTAGEKGFLWLSK